MVSLRRPSEIEPKEMWVASKENFLHQNKIKVVQDWYSLILHLILTHSQSRGTVGQFSALDSSICLAAGSSGDGQAISTEVAVSVFPPTPQRCTPQLQLLWSPPTTFSYTICAEFFRVLLQVINFGGFLIWGNHWLGENEKSLQASESMILFKVEKRLFRLFLPWPISILKPLRLDKDTHAYDFGSCTDTRTQRTWEGISQI